MYPYPRAIWCDPELDWVLVYRVCRGEATGRDLGDYRPATVRYLHHELGWGRTTLTRVLHCSSATISADLAGTTNPDNLRAPRQREAVAA